MTKARITKAIRECGIPVVRVSSAKEAKQIGIHLLNPTQYELENALEKAERDMFPAVYIHDFKTWGYQHGYHRPLNAEERRAKFTLINGGAA